MANNINNKIKNKENTSEMIMYGTLGIMGYLLFNTFTVAKDNKEMLDINEKEPIQEAINKRHIGGLIVGHGHFRIACAVILIALFYEDILVIFDSKK